MTRPTHPTSIKLDRDLHARIESLAASKQRTPHWMMKEAIRQYVEREEKYQTFQQEVLASWEDFQVSGKHVSAEEVEKWIESWGTENELPAPTCHR